MSKLDERLGRMLPALTPTERAVLVLRRYKEGKPQDQSLGWRMDPRDTREYNRLISLIQVCNTEVLTVIVLLNQLVDKLHLRLLLLTTLAWWQEQADQVEHYLRNYTKEPITKSEHEALMAAEPERWAPVAELADLLVSAKTDWTDEEIEDPEKGIVWAESWAKNQDAQEKQLRDLVREGEMEGRGRGKDLQVRVGSFCENSCLPVTVLPEWGCGYEAYADAEAVTVERGRWARARLRESIARTPVGLVEGLSEALPGDLLGLWKELQALNVVLDEVAKEFDGEDVLKPKPRADLDRVKQDLLKAHTVVRLLADEDFELPEPNEEAVDEVRESIASLVEWRK